ncbi:MAG: hydantoinase/oxoprolinase family protein [Alphaproteobacteria bacterium]|nr:hydantoinase/oxoprolinase family protein [Alphaproteobacteria bacterium]
MQDDSATWRVGVDIGGTFTDVVLWDSAGDRLILDKLLTTPDDPSRAVLDGIATVLDQAGITADSLGSVIHGTTLVANALIERKGVPTALITTAGFRDVLEIGREWRYDLFDLHIDMPQPLVPRSLRFEVSERVGPDGEVILPLDVEGVKQVIDDVAGSGAQSLAVCLLHAYRRPDHERTIAAAVRDRLPYMDVSLSSDVSPELGEYERTSTTVANAYVHPIFRGYVERLVTALTGMGYRRDLLLVLSDGRCVRADVAVRYPIRLVQSGPAAGAEAARMFGELAKVDNVLCFDMGGTTAKACLIPDGEPERTVRFEVARETRFAEGSGLPLQIPAIDMIEIGAGGGSIARVDERGLIQVGPDSAGADPGPVSYGRGNTLPTVTDCDLLLGYLDPGSFLGGRMSLDKTAAERAVAEYLAEPLGINVLEAAWGVHETVTASMAQAATIHAIERALDPTRFTLLAIGGAGPVHACSMARKMSINRLVCPVGAGVASAIGMLASSISFEIARAAPTTLDALDLTAAQRMLGEMDAEATALVTDAGVGTDQVSRRLSAMMRYVGQGYEIETTVPADMLARGDREGLRAAFAAAYRHRYGRSEAMAEEILSWRLAVEGPRSALAGTMAKRGSRGLASAPPIGLRPVWFGDGFIETPVYRRADIRPGTRVVGPAVVEEGESTTVLPPDFILGVDGALNLIIERRVP